MKECFPKIMYKLVPSAKYSKELNPDPYKKLNNMILIDN